MKFKLLSMTIVILLGIIPAYAQTLKLHEAIAVIDSQPMQAIRGFREAIKNDPYSVTAHSYLAVTLFEQQLISEYNQEIEVAINLGIINSMMAKNPRFRKIYSNNNTNSQSSGNKLIPVPLKEIHPSDIGINLVSVPETVSYVGSYKLIKCPSCKGTKEITKFIPKMKKVGTFICKECSGEGLVRCGECSGTGNRGGDYVCNVCKGRGKRECIYCDHGVATALAADGFIEKRVPCESCEATGKALISTALEHPGSMEPQKIKVGAFFIQKTEVTQKQWKEVMSSEPWKGVDGVIEGDDYPASMVSYFDAVEFVKRLNGESQVINYSKNIKIRITPEINTTYALPTQDEWEVACRAATTTKYFFGDDGTKLSKYSWFQGIEKNAHQVAKLEANPYGLFDMNGNLSEWCLDSILDYDFFLKNNINNDKIRLIDGNRKIVRGGHWWNAPDKCCSFSREFYNPETKSKYIGFRVVAHFRQ